MGGEGPAGCSRDVRAACWAALGAPTPTSPPFCSDLHTKHRGGRDGRRPGTFPWLVGGSGLRFPYGGGHYEMLVLEAGNDRICCRTGVCRYYANVYANKPPPLCCSL